ncbi:MAG: ribonuclease [Oceanospirillaceae bacterium]|uniref:PhoH family protein n=1 Tax=unclassified Thalassolituus TaxID=2624967 RepID=UPI000C099A27|nr:MULTISPECIES: PhoH family protein [unclassified Thalassolituus]MAK92172.1 ribonuclease [Thalassolituus sp.]MAS24830.1 ribonuclease [Oceanospirillaceae bacterium]MAX97781.1 ribonuclease [Oceanospirillaceae bacterium]MBL34750.1 ribonuclease [Oceanospirillaceae bacterium]MBS52824.1 ribonuclease [Oceanospirillaceae bacterium]|tara:strand:+ start:1894 stop:3273 length:1380 start_codon:yes stop_codon:yes gene_type:complete
MAALKTNTKLYVLDTNVLIHDPAAILNFEEHQVVIPMTVLEELDKLKMGKAAIATDCREAIRKIDKIIGDASPTEVAKGVPIIRPDGSIRGHLSILLDTFDNPNRSLPEHLNDNKIINGLVCLQEKNPRREVVLITKDINMRLKARGCGIGAQDYQNDQLLDDVSLLETGYHTFVDSFWETQAEVETFHDETGTFHRIPLVNLPEDLCVNRFIVDEKGFVGRVVALEEYSAVLQDLPVDQLMSQTAWGLTPRDIPQALALYLLLDPDVHLVTLSGQAGSGKTILALAAAIEMTVASRQFKRIIATRSTRGLDEDIGYLPGTEAEKMEPWLGAITDNLEALHNEDENATSSVDYILQKVPLQFKSLNYIRGRSFQQSLILIDECQNLTPHQMKTIITRAGAGSKVICLGNLAQIDTPYLNPISSGLTYLIERFKEFSHGATVHLEGSPRSILAEYAETHL